MELIQQLVNNLGVNEGQAKGGAGLLFNLAKNKLGAGEFQRLADKVPAVKDLLGAAPASSTTASAGGSMMGALGGLASSLGAGGLGEKMGGLENLANLASGFSQLGLSPDMIGKFLPIVLSFVQNQGGDSMKGLLEKVLKPAASTT
ncbi:MAG: DUF2780 domain-containing protein [Nitrospiraceae bacterium]|nr:DUF2780 domain-containing protein [Nitrospira sp.]MCA9455736.1 DUF2780 domain-containing protein [Nitrospira sp.]MCB9776289.1 DUF2780 domain-containing protein [Nitrospiraceae bacterium]